MQATKNSGLSGLETEKSSVTKLKGSSGAFDFQTEPPGYQSFTADGVFLIRLVKVGGSDIARRIQFVDFVDKIDASIAIMVKRLSNRESPSDA